MGLYAEPRGDKLAWIEQHGTPVYDLRALEVVCYTPVSTQLPVVLLQTGFAALGVAYSQAELKRFVQGRSDGRWYLVPKAELRKVVAGGEKMKELR